jgi:hypothetical protein
MFECRDEWSINKTVIDADNDDCIKHVVASEGIVNESQLISLKVFYLQVYEGGNEMEVDPYNKYIKLTVIALLVVATFYIASLLLSQYKKQAAEETAVKFFLDSLTEQTGAVDNEEEQFHKK